MWSNIAQTWLLRTVVESDYSWDSCCSKMKGPCKFRKNVSKSLRTLVYLSGKCFSSSFIVAPISLRKVVRSGYVASRFRYKGQITNSSIGCISFLWKYACATGQYIFKKKIIFDNRNVIVCSVHFYEPVLTIDLTVSKSLTAQHLHYFIFRVMILSLVSFWTVVRVTMHTVHCTGATWKSLPLKLLLKASHRL